MVGSKRNWKILLPKKARKATGSLEEVEGVSRRGSVHDDEVEAAFFGQLVELLHRHVLLGARESFGQVAVEAVLKDSFGLLGRIGMLADEVVEGALRVELKSPELAVPLPFHLTRRVPEVRETRVSRRGAGQGRS